MWVKAATTRTGEHSHQKEEPRSKGTSEYLYTFTLHYGDVIMGTISSQITSPTTVYSTLYSGADQIKYRSSSSLAFVRGIHRGQVNYPHKWPVTRKMLPFDDVIMNKPVFYVSLRSPVASDNDMITHHHSLLYVSLSAVFVILSDLARDLF